MRPKIPLRWGILKKYGSVVALKLDTWYERLLRGPSPRFKSCLTPAKTILCMISNSQEFMYVCWSLNIEECNVVSFIQRNLFNGDRTKLLPYTNFYVEVLTQYRIKLLHVEVLTNVRIKLLHIEVLTIFPDKTSTLTK